MLVKVLLIVSSVVLTSCDVSHLSEVSHLLPPEVSTEPPPPKPYAFSYTAGRYPGHADRQHSEVSDGSGVVRGSFSYVDPRHKLRTVDYIADKEGFHPVLSDPPPEHPNDSEAVAKAKDRHYQLYAKIAEEHAQHPYPDQATVPRQSAAVAAAAARHSQLFQVIAEQHARIAAEREALQREEELAAAARGEDLQELGHRK